MLATVRSHDQYNTTIYDKVRNFVAMAFDIARGSVAAYYPEANGLVALADYDRQSGTPSYKSVPAMLRRAASGAKASHVDREDAAA